MASKKKKPVRKAAPPKKAAKQAKPKPAAKAAKPATKLPPKPAPKPAPSPAAAAAAAKALKPLTLKQRLSLIRIDPTTGKCPHGLIPETCSFCMNI